MKNFPILLLVLFALISCIPISLPDFGSDVVAEGKYNIGIWGPLTSTRLKGDNVDTQWIPEDGWIFLNTEEIDSLRPIGTITLQLGHFTNDVSVQTYFLDSLGRYRFIKSDRFEVVAATVSKTEKRKGTAAELDAKLFTLSEPGELFHAELGANYIRGYLQLKMERERTNPNDPNFVPEIVLVTGQFTAMSR